MARNPKDFDYGTDDALKDIGGFQALFEKVMQIPEAGRNLYQQWLAGRWKEAAANWAMSSNPELNMVPVQTESGGFVYDMIPDDEGINRDVQRMATGKFVGEEFEDYLNRLRGSKELFGGAAPNAIFAQKDRSRRLNQLQERGGVEQRALLDQMASLLGGTGISGQDIANEAFLNAAESRFGRRGARATAASTFSPAAARAFQISPLGGLDPTGEASFLNQRIQSLRNRYGF